MYQVYILNNTKGRKYIGLTQNLKTRVLQHNSGRSRWTRGKGPWSVIWVSPSMNLGDARKLENKLKRQKGGLGVATLTGLIGS